MHTGRGVACLLAALALLGLTASAGADTMIVDGAIYGVAVPGTYDYYGTTVDWITFDVTAGTTVFFNVRAWENDDSGPVDLNGDGAFTAFDSQISLFSGDLFQYFGLSDDYNQEAPYAWDADGSVYPLDSGMVYTFSNSGSYLLAIGALYFDWSEAQQQITWGAHFYDVQTWESLYGPGYHGDYRVTITTENGTLSNLRLNGNPVDVVPEPATLSLMAMGLSGMVLRRIRRRRA